MREELYYIEDKFYKIVCHASSLYHPQRLLPPLMLASNLYFNLFVRVNIFHSVKKNFLEPLKVNKLS